MENTTTYRLCEIATLRSNRFPELDGSACMIIDSLRNRSVRRNMDADTHDRVTRYGYRAFVFGLGRFVAVEPRLLLKRRPPAPEVIKLKAFLFDNPGETLV